MAKIILFCRESTTPVARRSCLRASTSAEKFFSFRGRALALFKNSSAAGIIRRAPPPRQRRLLTKVRIFSPISLAQGPSLPQALREFYRASTRELISLSVTRVPWRASPLTDLAEYTTSHAFTTEIISPRRRLYFLRAMPIPKSRGSRFSTGFTPCSSLAFQIPNTPILSSAATFASLLRYGFARSDSTASVSRI